VDGVPAYLVFFVADPVDDALARDLRALVRAVGAEHDWSGRPPGWFDDPQAPPAERTAGAFLRVDSEPAAADVAAVWAAAVAASATFDVAVELQWREEILGRVHGGVAEAGLAERMGAIA
jgi:hypothetical protein